MYRRNLSSASLCRFCFWFAAFSWAFWTSSAAILVNTNSVWRYQRGTNAALLGSLGWTTPAFNDIGWASGATPFYYGETVTGGTQLSGMQNSFLSVLLRKTFQISDPARFGGLTVDYLCDDGLAIWINGVEAHRYNLPNGNLTGITNASGAVAEPYVPQSVILPSSAALKAGENVIAVRLLNANLSSSDVFLDLSLSAVELETNPPVVLSILPSPGEQTALTEIQVTFSEPVSGVDATDLVVGGFAAIAVTGSGATWTFQCTQPPFGDVAILWAGGHGIADLALPPNAFNAAGPGATWSYVLRDPAAPSVERRLPPSGSTVSRFNQTEIWFSEPVEGVDAADLEINGRAAESVEGFGSGPYVFRFASPVPGTAQLAWRAGHAIRDLSVPSQSLLTAPWQVELDPSATNWPVQIHEILAVNSTGLKDEDGDTSAWIELRNQSDRPVQIGGWSLTDDEDVPDAWVLPNVTLPANGYLVVWADGKDRSALATRLHTNFKLSRGGEYLGLYNQESPRRAVSELRPGYPVQRPDVSYGLDGVGAWKYFQTPSPAGANVGSTLSEACEPVQFSVERGYFDTPFEVNLSTATPGARIRFTLDGSEPSGTNGFTYVLPVSVGATTTLRAMAVRDGFLPSSTRTHTYLYNITARLKAIPSLSLVTASNNIAGRTGIVGIGPGYYNPNNRGIAWERPVSVELIDSDNSGFQVDAGIRLQASDYFRPRLTAGSKFSWRLYFRGDYGEGRLRYPWFDRTSVDEFDVIVCRAGSNDSSNPFIKDEFMRRLYAETGQVSSQGSFVALYLNGRYRGYYNPCERIESDFLQIHHGGGEFWDVMSQSGPIDGTRSDFDSMVTAARTRPMSNSANYSSFAARLDVTNFVDYLLVNMFGQNGDWPQNNWRAARERRPGALWRYYIWDAEFAFGLAGGVADDPFATQLGGGTEVATIHRGLMGSPEYRLLFADRVHKHIFNFGALSPSNALVRWNEMEAQMSQVISGFDRSIRTSWIPSRNRFLLSHIARQRLHASTNAPVFLPHGGLVPAGQALLITNLFGPIWYTTNGTDPRTPFTGVPSIGALEYDRANPPRFESSVYLRARSVSNGVWSAVTDAAFSVEEFNLPIRITEIMAAPPGGNAYEFLEVSNLSDRFIDVSGVRIRGVDYVFPARSLMPARAVWVIASDQNPSAFAARYPRIVVQGRYRGSLADKGERLTLLDPRDNELQVFEYDSGKGWPDLEDPQGRSLEWIPGVENYQSPAAWTLSGASGGSPGIPQSALPPPSNVAFLEVCARNTSWIQRDATFPDFITLTNHSSSFASLANMVLRLGDSTNEFRFPVAARLAGQGRLTLWCDDLVVPGEFHTGFNLPREGGALILLRGEEVIDRWSYGPHLPNAAVVRGPGGYLLRGPGAGEGTVVAGTNVVINEWLANPASDDDGSDWLELHNRSPRFAADIGGHWLNLSNVWHRIPSPTFLAPGGFVRLRADGDPGPDHIVFKLPATGGVIRWLDPSGVELDRATYRNAASGVSRGRLPDGSTEFTDFLLTPTPGESNQLPQGIPVRLNEIMAFHDDRLAGPRRNGDWIEIFNPGDAAVVLDGYRISYRRNGRQSVVIPKGTILEAGRHWRIWADTNAWPSTGWELPDHGASLLLEDASGRAVDAVSYGPQLRGRSIGQVSGGWKLLAEATPEQVNSAAAALDDGSRLRLNEWSHSPLGTNEWLEIFHGGDLPFPMERLRVTDDPSQVGTALDPLPALGFIEARGFLLLARDAGLWPGSLPLPFGLDSSGEMVRLVVDGVGTIDNLNLLFPTPAHSTGRNPDGGPLLATYSQPTPGASNAIDLDGDQMDDRWERAFGLDPTSAADVGLDPDGDGASNRAEYRAGTDPNDRNSLLGLVIRQGGGIRVQIEFSVAALKSYTLQTSPTAAPNASWSNLRQYAAGMVDQVLVETLPLATNANTFFRLVTPATR